MKNEDKTTSENNTDTNKISLADMKQYKENAIKIIEKIEQDDSIDEQKLQRVKNCKTIISNLEKKIKELEDFHNKSNAEYNKIKGRCLNEK